MVETVYHLCQPSMFTTTFPAKPGSNFFFPFGHVSLFDLKHESDQNPEVIKIKFDFWSDSVD